MTNSKVLQSRMNIIFYLLFGACFLVLVIWCLLFENYLE